MEEGNITVLVDAKEEYTKQLISILKLSLYQGIKSIFLDAKDICNQDNRPADVLMVFQDLLGRVPKWSQDIINNEFQRIINVSKCDYIDDLIKVIYVTHIKVLTIVHSAKHNSKISLKVPSGSHFMHLCYIECAREFWKNPYYFSENLSKYELQKNMRESESMITECILESVRKQLPVRNILKEYLNEPDADIDEKDEDIKDPINKKYMKRLETVIKKELKNSATVTNNKNNTTNINSDEITVELIRKVIRDELATHPEISNTNIIKQKLVTTVIDKIIEQVNTDNENDNENDIVIECEQDSENLNSGNSTSKKNLKNKPTQAAINDIVCEKDLTAIAPTENKEYNADNTDKEDNADKENNANTDNTYNNADKKDNADNANNNVTSMPESIDTTKNIKQIAMNNNKKLLTQDTKTKCIITKDNMI